MRIKVIDGFRAIAVLGVLWSHTWKFSGTPPCTYLKIDIAKIMNFFGTGVDLFFVISGFCMFLMYNQHKPAMSFSYYGGYLKKRWFRIAPAFYAAVIFYGLAAVGYNLKLFDWSYALKHILFIKNFFTDATRYAPHFWSLCTEWHFYMLLPFIIVGIERFKFINILIIVIIACLIFRLIVWQQNNDLYNLVNYSIPNRLIEFIMGILTAKVYLSNSKAWIFNTIKGLLTGVLIAFAGRVLMTAANHDRTDIIGTLSRTFDLPLLTLGFGLVITNALRKRTLFSSFLETGLMTSIGKYSYSMYLWHYVVAVQLSNYAALHWHFNSFIKVNIVFIVAVLILYPVSILSYKLFESFYFMRKKTIMPDIA